MIKKFIPNFFTMLNLLCGSVATIFAVQNNLVFAAVFVGLGIFFDFFDGFAARMLNVPSAIGLQLDSLADMVTSGLVPAIVMVQLLTQSLGGLQENGFRGWEDPPAFELGFPPLALVGLLIALASGYRLAKFNVDDRQTSSFIGLPTPANAILILSLPLIVVYQPSPRVMTFVFNPWVLVTITFLSSVLLNAELPLFGLKFSSWGFKSNWFRYLFLGLSVLALLWLQFLALPFIILGYVLLSVSLLLLREN